MKCRSRLTYEQKGMYGMSGAEEKTDNRSLALYHIANYVEHRLGFSKADFIEWFSEEQGGKSEKTLWRYIRGDSPMKKWSFEQFWGLVESTVQHYLEYDKDMGRPLTPHAAEIWEQEKAEQEERCRFYFLTLEATERTADFPEAARDLLEIAEKDKRETLEDIRPVFEKLDQETAYRLRRNFPALASTTAEDALFLAHFLTRTEEEKETLKAAMLQGATVDAETMLACLQSEEVRCWADLKNGDYEDTSRKAKGSWDEFCEKFMELSLLQYPGVSLFLKTPLLLAFNNIDPKTGKATVKLPGEVDLDLLLLFKYCLAPKERERFRPSK